jgi:outer membrane protein assembly factor BamA
LEIVVPFVALWILLIAVSSAAAQPSVVRSIDIDGLHHTRRWVVERELRFTVGDTITADQLEAARKRLQNYVIFNDVRARLDSAGTVKIAVSEAFPLWPYLTVSFSEGQITDVITEPDTFFDKATLYTGASYVNFRGEANTVFAVMQWGAAEGFSLGYRTRWLAPRLPLSVEMDVENLRISDRRAAVLDCTRYLRNAQYSLDVATRQGAASQVGLWLAYRGVKQEDRYPAEGRRFRTVWAAPHVTLDRRDLEWYPTRGAYASVWCDLAGGDVRFIRSRYDLRGYFPLIKRARPPLLALNFTAATSSSGTPSWAHFYSGFDTGPRGYLNAKTEAAGYLSAAAEFRFPVTREMKYNVRLLGRYGRRWPLSVLGALFVQRAQYTLNGRRFDRLGGGGGLYLRVPFVHIVEFSWAVNRDGETEFGIKTGVEF